MQIKIPDTQNILHLTYCMNIHPGEDWQSVFDAVREYACDVRRRLGITGKFGLGLRLSAEAAENLEQGDNLAHFAQFLADNKLYVFTINGFPYGQFHNTRVKENVYEPDWSTPERLDYTKRLVRILTALLPAGVPGSISTLPGTYGRQPAPEKVDKIMDNLLQASRYCCSMSNKTDRTCRLAVEPEPGCLWECTEDLIQLFNHTLPEFAQKYGAQNWSEIKQGLGVCIDTCHQAVLFEDVKAALLRLRQNNIAIPKIQLSAGLICPPASSAVDELEAFAEPVYLHQCALREHGSIRRFADLPQALAVIREANDGAELRSHFHVPLFASSYGALKSTSNLLDDEFFRLLRDGISANIEVETYSFTALPPEHQSNDVVANVTKELQWVLDKIGPVAGPSFGKQ